MRLLSLLKSKIHHAHVTDANVNYVGSITIDANLLGKVGIIEGEEVRVWNVTNGYRFETYALAGEADSGIICVNGAAAHNVSKGDKIIIAAFCWSDEAVMPQQILLDEANRFVENL